MTTSTKQIQWYVDIKIDGTIGFYNDDIYQEPKGLPISEEIYKNLLYEVNQNQKLLYIDDSIIPDGMGNQIKCRDKYTIWDDATQSWIPDVDKIAQIKKRQLIRLVKNQLDKTSCYDLPSYRSRLSKKQNQINDEYRVQLWDIAEGKIEVDELPQDPNELLEG